MRVKSSSSEMNRGQNSELAKVFMLIRSAMSVGLADGEGDVDGEGIVGEIADDDDVGRAGLDHRIRAWLVNANPITRG